jgi:hypothetical protein
LGIFKPLKDPSSYINPAPKSIPWTKLGASRFSISKKKIEEVEEDVSDLEISISVGEEESESDCASF